MQTLNCDLWLMERSAFENLHALTLKIVPPTEGMAAELAKMSVEVTHKPQKNVAVLPIHGALEARPSWMGAMFGMSNYERLGQVFQAVMADDAYSHIVLDCATPGGMVYGCAELADLIYQSRGKGKPIIAVANPMAASGGYWLAAAADRVIVTPSGDVGSVGVIAEHVDMSARDERLGWKVTVFRSGQSPYKQESNPSEALTEEGRMHFQSRVDQIYDRFAADLAKFRRVSVEHVNEKFGKGRLVDAQAAVAAGMADRVDTLAGTIAKINAGRVRIGGASAEDVWDTYEAIRQERTNRISHLAGISGKDETNGNTTDNGE